MSQMSAGGARRGPGASGGERGGLSWGVHRNRNGAGTERTTGHREQPRERIVLTLTSQCPVRGTRGHHIGYRRFAVFARVSIYDIPEGRTADAAASFAGALETISAARGLSEALFLVSRESNRGIALTLWDDQEAMSASRVTASRLRSAAIEAVGGEVVAVDEFEVAVRTRPGDR
jgi:heme-degrading monooxygenase HmoA